MTAVSIRIDRPVPQLEVKLPAHRAGLINESPDPGAQAEAIAWLQTHRDAFQGVLAEAGKKLQVERNHLSAAVSRARGDFAKEERLKNIQARRTRRIRRLERWIDLIQKGRDTKLISRGGIDAELILACADGGKRSYGPLPGRDIRAEYEKRWRELSSRWSAVGLPLAALNRLRRSHEKELCRLEGIRKSFSEGALCSEIAADLELSPVQVASWIVGRQVPFSLKWILNPPANLRNYPIPRQESADFAYLLGTYASCTKASRKQMNLVSQDREAVVRFQHAVKRCFGSEPAVLKLKALKNVPQWKCLLPSVTILAHMRQVTLGNTAVPWEHLGTEAEQRAYLQGILDFNSGVTRKTAIWDGVRCGYPVVGLTFSNRPELACDLMVLFGKHGILPTKRDYLKPPATRVERLEIGSKTDIDRTLALGFNAQRKQHRLAWLRARTKYVMPDHDWETYYAARRLWQSGRSRREVALALGLPPSLIKTWKEGSRPKRVGRYEAIQAIAAQRPRPEVLNYLYRDLGLPPSTCRALEQGGAGLSELKEQVNLWRAAGVDPGIELERQCTLSRSAGGRPEVMSEAETRRLIALFQSGRQEARNQVVAGHMGLVWMLVNKLVHRRIESSDLASEGAIGLIRAVELFDLKRRSADGKYVAFSTYALWWIRAFVNRAMHKARLVQLPEGVKSDLRRLERVEERLRQLLGRSPSDSEVAARMDWNEDDVKAHRELKDRIRVSSIDAPLGADSDNSRKDLLGEDEPPEVDGEKLELRALLEECFRIAGLSPRLSEVLRMRFGIAPYEVTHTLEQVGKKIKRTRERARQLEAKALRLLRESEDPRVRALHEYLDPG